MRVPRGLLLLLSTCAALGALELACRLWLPPLHHHAGQALVFDAKLGFRGEAGARVGGMDAQGPFELVLDAQGLRRREGAVQGALHDLVLLGDSFVAALGVRDSDTMASRLEAELARRGMPTAVHDLAVVDYGTAQELLLWRALGAPLRAETTVLVLYPSNDLANNTLALAGRTAVSPGDYLRPYLVPQPGGGFARRFAHPWRAALRRGSRLFAWLEHRTLAFGVAHAIAWLAPWPAPEVPEARLREGRAPREDLELFREPAPGSAWDEAWSTSLRLLVALRDEVQARGGRLVVLVIPSLLQVQEEASGIELDLLARQYAGRAASELLDWNLPERRLAELFAGDGMDAVLLLDDFREAAGRGGTLYLPDGHLSRQGHALAAARLAAALAGGAPARAVPPRSAAPVALLPPPESAPGWLDFRAASYETQLVRGGWLVHRTNGEAAGWQPGAHASLVLPARRGDLVLRGQVPSDATLPISARLRLGDAAAQIDLREPGPFELRLPAPFAQDEPRWALVRLEFSARSLLGRLPAQLSARAVGFE